MSEEEAPRQASQERDRSEHAAPAEEFKIFVGGISWHMDDRELKDTFKKYGAIDARVMLDRLTNRSRGFGFVHFDNKEDLEEAIEKMHDTEIDGRKISVTRAIPQDSVVPGTPAAAIGRRGDNRYAERRYDRYERYPPRVYERYPPRGYDRAERTPYDRYDYDRAYDRYSYGYERDYGRDPYARADPYDRYGYGDAYERDPYYGGYSRSRDPYDRYEPDRRGYDRYRSGGPDRGYDRYTSSRAGPYERSGMNGRAA